MKYLITALLAFSASVHADILISTQSRQFSTRPDDRQSLSVGPYTFTRSQAGSVNVGGQVLGQNFSTTTRGGRTEFQVNGQNFQVSPHHATVNLFGAEITFTK